MNCGWSDAANKARQVVVRVRNLNIRVIRIGVLRPSCAGPARIVARHFGNYPRKKQPLAHQNPFLGELQKIVSTEAVNKEIGLIANPHLTTRVSESEQKGGASCLGIVILVVVCLLR